MSEQSPLRQKQLEETKIETEQLERRSYLHIREDAYKAHVEESAKNVSDYVSLPESITSDRKANAELLRRHKAYQLRLLGDNYGEETESGIFVYKPPVITETETERVKDSDLSWYKRKQVKKQRKKLAMASTDYATENTLLLAEDPESKSLMTKLRSRCAQFPSGSEDEELSYYMRDGESSLHDGMAFRSAQDSDIKKENDEFLRFVKTGKTDDETYKKQSAEKLRLIYADAMKALDLKKLNADYIIEHPAEMLELRAKMRSFRALTGAACADALKQIGVDLGKGDEIITHRTEEKIERPPNPKTQWFMDEPTYDIIVHEDHKLVTTGTGSYIFEIARMMSSYATEIERVFVSNGVDPDGLSYIKRDNDINVEAARAGAVEGRRALAGSVKAFNHDKTMTSRREILNTEIESKRVSPEEFANDRIEAYKRISGSFGAGAPKPTIDELRKMFDNVDGAMFHDRTADAEYLLAHPAETEKKLADLAAFGAVLSDKALMSKLQPEERDFLINYCSSMTSARRTLEEFGQKHELPVTDAALAKQRARELRSAATGMKFIRNLEVNIASDQKIYIDDCRRLVDDTVKKLGVTPEAGELDGIHSPECAAEYYRLRSSIDAAGDAYDAKRAEVDAAFGEFMSAAYAASDMYLRRYQFRYQIRSASAAQTYGQERIKELTPEVDRLEQVMRDRAKQVEDLLK